MISRPLTERITLPSPPQVPGSLGMSPDFRAWLKQGVEKWDKDMVRALEQDLGDVHSSLNQWDSVGETLTAASTLYVSARIHMVTGTDTIQKIIIPPDPTPPTAPLTFSGRITLIALDSWQIFAVAPPDGNVALDVSPVVNLAVDMIYVPQVGLWYPAFHS